jgi:hypothetical protein
LSAAAFADVPFLVVTVTSTPPEWWRSGAFTVISVADTTFGLVAFTVPKWTAVVPVKFFPVIVTVSPPPRGPLVGTTFVTDGLGGGATYLNLSPATLAEVPPAVVTVTSTVPVPLGDRTMVVVPVWPLIVAAFAPKCTDVGFAKSLPVMVTLVPPTVEPFVGEIFVTTGLGVFLPTAPTARPRLSLTGSLRSSRPDVHRPGPANIARDCNLRQR